MATFLRPILIILNLIFLPVTIFALFAMSIYKQLVCLMAKCFENFVEPIPGSSIIWFSDHYYTNPTMTVVNAISLDRICTKEEVEKWSQQKYDLRDKFGRRCYREMAYYPVRYFGYGFWKKVPNFKINRIHDLSKCTDIKEGEKFMERVSEFLQYQPFNENEPLWDLYYHHTSEKTIIYFRFHHLLADGMSFIKLIYSDCNIPQGPILPKPKFLSWDYIRNIFATIWTAILLISCGYVDYLMNSVILRDKHSLTCDAEGNFKMCGTRRCTAGERFDLQEVKRASKKLNCSVSHIFLAGINIGLEKYFAKYYGYEITPTFGISLVLPLPNHPNLQLVNCWTLGKIYSANCNLNIREKVEHMKVEWHGVRTSMNTLFWTHLLQNIAQFLPRKLQELTYKAKAYTTIYISNVLVPPNDNLRIAGSKISDMWFWLPIAQQSYPLSASILSVNGGIRVCYNADVGCIKKREELDDLAALTYSSIREIINLNA